MLAPSVRVFAACVSVAAAAACVPVLVGCSDQEEDTAGVFFLQWQHDLETSTYGRHRLAFDRQGDLVVVAADPSGCVALMKLAGDGSLLWSRPYDESEPRCPREADVALDGYGNIVIAGALWDIDQVVVWKHDAAGEPVWTRYQEGGWFTFTGSGRHLALDPQGSIVTGGFARRPLSSYELIPWVAKLDPQGSERWNRALENIPGSVCAVVSDDDGNTWVAEDRISISVLEQLDPNGSSVKQVVLKEQWQRCPALARDGEGSLLLLTPATLRKYSATGDSLWEVGTTSHHLADGQELSFEQQLVAAAPNGSIYVLGSGSLPPSCPGEDPSPACLSRLASGLVLRKLDAGGAEQWVRFLQMSWSSVEIHDLAVAGDGTVAVAGKLLYPDRGFVGVVMPATLE